MNTKIKGLWWKLLGVLIFIYVLIGGLTTPLNSGILFTTPSSAKSGTVVDIEVTGYNTHFESAKNHRAWLKADSIHAIKTSGIRVIDEIKSIVTFEIPDALPAPDKVQSMTLILDNELDGTFVQPNAIFISMADTISANGALWKTDLPGNFSKVDKFVFPYRNILHETIRNIFFHVALWFAMFIMLLMGLYYAIKYLSTKEYDYDIQSAAYTKVAVLYGILGLATGSIWAKFTWNTFWTEDVKLNMTAVTILIYLAYLVLRSTFTDTDRRAKMSSAYNIFAFIAMIPLLFVIPRMTDSLHPGNGGNPALGGEDLDQTLRMFFYPSVIALSLLGAWISQLTIRYERLKERIYENLNE